MPWHLAAGGQEAEARERKATQRQSQLGVGQDRSVATVTGGCAAVTRQPCHHLPNPSLPTRHHRGIIVRGPLRAAGGFIFEFGVESRGYVHCKPVCLPTVTPPPAPPDHASAQTLYVPTCFPDLGVAPQVHVGQAAGGAAGGGSQCRSAARPQPVVRQVQRLQRGGRRGGCEGQWGGA